jgi:hypothetical protein
MNRDIKYHRDEFIRLAGASFPPREGLGPFEEAADWFDESLTLTNRSLLDRVARLAEWSTCATGETARDRAALIIHLVGARLAERAE